MLSKLRKQEGFTLIELLIVVAIIGILAAIAIPQFAAYRQRGFNSAAVSDLKNGKASEEAMFNDNGGYGKSEGPITLAVCTAGLAPIPATGLAGPMVGAAGAVAGGMVSGPDTQGNARAVAMSVSNGVTLIATLAPLVAPALSSASYTMSAKHLQGGRIFATETENTAVMMVENTAAWVGQALTTTTGYGTIPAASAGLDIPVGLAGGGSPVAAWAAM